MIAVTTSHLYALRSQQIFDWVRWERFITGCESWQGSKLMQMLLVILRFTPCKLNIAPEIIPSQKESRLPTIIFQGLCSTSGVYNA